MRKIFTILIMALMVSLQGFGQGQSTTEVFQMSIVKVSSSATKYRIQVRLSIYSPTVSASTFSLANSNYVVEYNNAVLANPVGISSALSAPTYDFTNFITNPTAPADPVTGQPSRKQLWINPVKSVYGPANGAQFSNAPSNPGCSASPTPPSGTSFDLVTVEFDVLPGQSGVNPNFKFRYFHDLNGTVDTQTWIDTSTPNTGLGGGFIIRATRILADGTGTWPASNSGLVICPSANTAALPVSLINFDARRSDKAVNLDWQTSTEVNSSVFEVERSTNGETYNRIGVVKAAGNSTAKLSYKITDNEPTMGINYYRLKIIDLDGTYEYSDVRMINFGNRDMQLIAAYPNPATTELTLNVYTPQASKAATLRILNAKGSVVVSQDVTTDIADGYIHFDISSIAQGVYIAEIISDKQVVRTRFVKQ